MTGNLVLLGVAIGRAAARTALRNVVAVAGYATGVVVGSRVAGRGPESFASPRIQRALAIEWVLQAIFLTGWIAQTGQPDGVAAEVLIAISGISMGIQAITVAALGSRLSTTYVTGIVTTLVRDLSYFSGVGAETARHGAAVLCLLAGAVIGSLVLATMPIAAPAVPLIVTGAVIVLARRTPPEEPQGL